LEVERGGIAMMKIVAAIAGLGVVPTLMAQGTAPPDAEQLSATGIVDQLDRAPAAAPPSAGPGGVNPTNAKDRREFEMDTSSGLSFDGDAQQPSLWSVLEPARFTVKHELGNQINEPYDVSNNRTSFRIEYEKHFFEDFYLQFDWKLTAFWGRDHRAQASGKSVFYESTSRDAYFQYSKANTSIKIGRQILIWGESDAGAITDVISPRNLSELFFISLEESRISQFMINVDQFTSVGDWSLFYVPDAQYNEYPEPGTAYYIDAFSGFAQVQGRRDEDLDEYGMRWKKTFGRSDLNLMAARLIDNDFSYRNDGVADDGQLLLTKVRPRFDMVGFTFNYARGDFLYSGEVARKSPRTFNDASFALLEKNVIDTSLRAEYSLGKGGTHSISLEAVNSHIQDWTPDVQGTPRNSNSLVFGWNNTFFNENLTANLLTVYTQPYTSLQHSLFLTYKWNDQLSLNLDAFYLSVDDPKNSLYVYRKENNVVFKVLYQF
jgi:hypothetical protein